MKPLLPVERRFLPGFGLLLLGGGGFGRWSASGLDSSSATVQPYSQT